MNFLDPIRDGIEDPSRRALLLAGLGAAALAGCAGLPASAVTRPVRRAEEWPAYGATNAAAKYSPLDGIHRGNLGKLRMAWEWESPDAGILDAHPELKPGEFQVTPIMIDGVLYVSTAMSQVAAIDAASGKTLWVYDPGTWRSGRTTSKGFLHRGVAYWSEGDDRRVLIGTGDARLIALDARNGQPVRSFGLDGEIDLRRIGLQRPVDATPSDLYGCTSPPLICRDTVVIGSYIHDRAIQALMPPGDVRGFDVRSGELKWAFHTVPLPGEDGYDTWLNGSAARNGNTNVWAPISADDELGLVYLPGSCPSNNVFGGGRPGDNLYGSTLIALDAETGQRRWHYQLVHHDVWDYDLPCAPNLIDLVVEGRAVKAVAQVTKQGFCFVFDRISGAPLWPIDELAVPQSTLAGERTAATQPWPTRPAPFEPQGITADMLVDYTPELKAEAVAMLARYAYGPLYTPYGGTPTIIRPSWIGGANWQGAAVDPETGVLYVPSQSTISALALGDDGSPISRGAQMEEIAGAAEVVRGPRGLPLIKPPYSRITAIDLNRGEHLWSRPNGPGATADPAFAAYRLGWIGSQQRAALMLTKTLLFVGEGPHDRRYARKVLRAYDKQTGDLAGEIALPGHVLGAPMSYSVGGRQHIVCAMGFHERPHKLVAFAEE